MDQLVFDTSESPTISIERVGGDMRVSGWDQDRFQAETADDGTVNAEQKNDTVAVTADGDCTLNVPRRAALQIVHVGGDAKVKKVEGVIEIQFVGGDLILRQVGPVTAPRVGGDLNAKKIGGSLAANAGGDASARSVTGDVTLKAGADVYLRDIGGGVHANAGSDAVLSTAFAPTKRYEVRAGSDILCRVPPDTSARFSIEVGSEITVDLLGAKIEGSARQKTVTLGAEAAQVNLSAGSDVSLTALTADPNAMGDFGDTLGREFGMIAEEFGSQIESIEAQMAEMERHLSEHLSHLGVHEGEPGRPDTEKFAGRAREAAQRATENARRKTEAARRRAEAKIEAAQRRAERMAERSRRKTGVFTMRFDGVRPQPPRPPAPAVTDEERMAVLKMLEQGKISIEQAEKLLAALEGDER